MTSRDLEGADPPRVFEVETHPADESSPLLRKDSKSSRGSRCRSSSLVRDEEPLAGENDEEAAPGAASIISLLLIGTDYHLFGEFQPLYLC